MRFVCAKTKRLADVLVRLRMHREALARQAFIAARSEAEALRLRIARARQALGELTGAVRSQLLAGAAGGVGCYRASVGHIRRVIAEQTLRLSEADETLRLRRDELAAAMKERKAADLLADGITTRQEMMQRRADAKELDEIAAVTSNHCECTDIA